MPTTLSFTHTLPPQLTHYFSGDLGTLSLGIPYHTCNATKVARETTGFFFVFFFQSYGGYLTVAVPFWVLVNSLNGLWCSHTSIHSILYFYFQLIFFNFFSTNYILTQTQFNNYYLPQFTPLTYFYYLLPHWHFIQFSLVLYYYNYFLIAFYLFFNIYVFCSLIYLLYFVQINFI